MKNEERIKGLKAEEYQAVFGVKEETFKKMLEILEKRSKEEHAKGGRPLKLSVLDKLIIMLSYYREYRPMENIAFDYNVAKSTVSESIKWVENILIKSGVFRLPSKRELLNNTEIRVAIIDATECEIERPQKNKNYIIQAKRRNIQ